MASGSSRSAAAARRAARVAARRSPRPASTRRAGTGGDLRVERLGRRHAHLDVATVGRVQHAVGLVGEVAVATVDDGDDGGARARGRGRRCGWCRWSCRDWLTATTSVSLMSAGRPNPESSVAVRGLDAHARAAGQRAEDGRPCSGRPPPPCPGRSRRCADGADASRSRRPAGSVRVTERRRGARRRARRAAAQGLAERLAAPREISLSRKCG